MTDEGPTLWDVVEAEHEALMAHDDVTLSARFETFHRENPRVYALLVRFARQLQARGYEHAGMKAIWERMRWEMGLETIDPDGFKLNNDFTSRYARLIMANEPELDGFFRTRRLTAL